MRERPRRTVGFTIIELLVVVSIIALLIGILLPAIGSARDNARLTQSQSNLRNLAMAHTAYAADWGDQQLTFVENDIARFSSNEATAFNHFWRLVGASNDIILGWENNVLWVLNRHYYSSFLPIAFPDSVEPYWGAFRLINAGNFHNYVNGRFYDEVFYAPKDRVVQNLIEPALSSPNSFSIALLEGQIATSSYVLSPAGMFNPAVLSRNPNTGRYFTDPWSIPAGFTTPSFSRALFPDRKSHMLEHHWLQNSELECNPAWGRLGSYDGCEPFYFNQAWASVPMTLFYDGHIEGFGVREAEQADTASVQQAGHGLWSRDTPFGADGYHSQIGFDYANTSYHIFTVDGIRGRDK